MDVLPNELLYMIFSKIDVKTLDNLFLVNKRFNTLTHLLTKNLLTINVTYYCGRVSKKTWEDQLGNKRVVYYYTNGCKSIEWWLDEKGKGNRMDGPAYLRWNSNGIKVEETWWINNQNHRINGPAIIHWYDNGLKESEEWLEAHKRHRTDGPAFSSWFKNGDLRCKQWYKDDNLCDNPNSIQYRFTNRVA